MVGATAIPRRRPLWIGTSTSCRAVMLASIGNRRHARPYRLRPVDGGRPGRRGQRPYRRVRLQTRATGTSFHNPAAASAAPEVMIPWLKSTSMDASVQFRTSRPLC